MKLLALFLFSIATAFATVAASPGGCVSSGGVISVHPCTATVSFAGATATAGEIAEVQAVLNSAQRGDTLITPGNKDINSCTLNISGTNWGGPADQYFVWKSEFYDSKFPPAGTRVTRTYASIATRISCNLAGSSRHLKIRGRLARGGAAAVDGVELKGLAFINTYGGTASVSGMIEVGENAVAAAVTDAATATTDNLTFTATDPDLLVFLYSGTATVKRDTVTVDPSEYTWQPWYGRVVFNAEQAPGVTITISASSFTATLPEHQPSRIRFRHIIADGEADIGDTLMIRAIILNANNSEVYDSHFQGFKNTGSDSQAIAMWSAYGPHIISNNYMGGAAENFMSGGSTNTLGRYSVKDLTLTYNYMPHESYTLYHLWTANTWVRKGTIIRQSTAANNQYIALTSGVTGSSTPTWDTTIGNTTTESGSTVTWKRLDTGRHYGFLKNNLEFKQVVGANVRFNYLPYMDNADQACSVNMKAESAGNEGNTPWNETKNILFAYNVLEHGFCPFNASTNEAKITGPGDGSTAFGAITVHNNLWRYYSASRLAANETPPCGGSSSAFMNFAGDQVLQNYFTNNLIDAWQDPGTNCTFAGEYNVVLGGSSNWIFRNNIMTRTLNAGTFPRPGFWGVDGSEPEGSPAIRRRMQHVTVGAGSLTTPIPAGRWTHNIMSGAPSGTYPNADTGDTGNTTYTTALGSIGFRDHSAGNFRLRTDSAFRNGSYNETKDLGPDWSMLPLMENFEITASDREALFTWTLTPAIKDIPCVMTFGSRDLLTPHADMDPATYTRPESDANDIHIRRGNFRMIRVGSRVALTPATQYGYRIECGGYAKEGYFTTAAALTGTASHTIRFVPTTSGTQTLTWGPTYSNATGAISGGGAPTATCSTGSTCAISFTGTRGQTYFYRLNSGRVFPVVIP